MENLKPKEALKIIARLSTLLLHIVAEIDEDADFGDDYFELECVFEAAAKVGIKQIRGLLDQIQDELGIEDDEEE